MQVVVVILAAAVMEIVLAAAKGECLSCNTLLHLGALNSSRWQEIGVWLESQALYRSSWKQQGFYLEIPVCNFYLGNNLFLNNSLFLLGDLFKSNLQRTEFFWVTGRLVQSCSELHIQSHMQVGLSLVHY